MCALRPESTLSTWRSSPKIPTRRYGLDICRFLVSIGPNTRFVRLAMNGYILGGGGCGNEETLKPVMLVSTSKICIARSKRRVEFIATGLIQE
ncbi:uncharacterized protein LAJ45_08457 [Morchella importuna]|uniref:uncharacterized protein n=1 Tax=Morchella importuna TaxID=1174673 RepID=UPI001E8D2BA4|nr:uncharacterized protein LAJ45_08457 [Morchella importuna]KAH8147629.1 hypothetical protein LAJ45_08457 [Morchella importuna]